METALSQPAEISLSTESSRELLWRAGIIAPWYLRKSQLDLYELLHRERNPFAECSRRWGKTTTILVYVFEQLMANPGWVCRWVLPEKDQARTIVKPEVEKLLMDCPEGIRPEFQTTDSVYVFKNGSKLFLYGVDKDKGKKLRGPFAHIVVADEYGFWNHPRVLKSVLRPQLLTTRGQLIIASTPPEDTTHPYYREYEKARRLDRFIQKTIYDNESLTAEDIATEMEEQGGENSPTWQREYLCRHIGDPELLVIPEFDDQVGGLNVIPDDTKRPERFDCYVGGDSGLDDNTAILFGYYDFLNDEVIIEEEFVTHGKTSKDIVEAAKAIEAQLWDKQPPLRRVYDANKQLLFDICATLNYPVERPNQADKTASIHQFRERVRQGKFKIKERCRNTIRTIKHGQWKDAKHEDFKRSSELGHLDPLAAALYFNRSVITSRNPYPQYGPDVSHYTHFIPQEASSQGNQDEAAFAAALDPLAEGF